MNKPYSNILVHLLKGIVYSDDKYWNELLQYETDVKRYFADIYLDVVTDKSEGYAYLKQKVYEDEENDIPKLIEKRPLNFYVSLICLLLRKHLIENDREGASSKAYLKREELLNMMQPFCKETTNEANQIKQIDSAIKKVIDEGFLRKMKTEEEQYEINRIIKAFVNADVVKESLEKLKNYTNPRKNEQR